MPMANSPQACERRSTRHLSMARPPRPGHMLTNVPVQPVGNVAGLVWEPRVRQKSQTSGVKNELVVFRSGFLSRRSQVRVLPGPCGRASVNLDRRVDFHQRLENDGGPELRIDDVRIEDMIADVLAGAGLGRTVERRAAVEIRRIDALGVVTIAVESLEPEQDSGELPIACA